MKLALLGFDGLDPRVVYQHEDRMPVLHDIIESSMYGSWRTPGHTIPSFTATLTGKQYNVVNFHWDDDGGDYQRHRQVPYDFLWDICDASMTLLNIPTLYPPEEIDDAMVCGFLAPDSVADSNLARPVEVQELLNDTGYIHDIHADNTYDELGGDGMYKYLQKIASRRVDVAFELIERYNSDLFYGVWTGTDRWFHQCTKHGEDFLKMYDVADKVINSMMTRLPDDIPVIIFSDHGFAHFPRDDGVHKGHMYDGFYCINSDSVPSYRDDSVSIFDLFPTVANYLGCEVPDGIKGRILFHSDIQDEEVMERLRDLGYTE